MRTQRPTEQLYNILTAGIPAWRTTRMAIRPEGVECPACKGHRAKRTNEDDDSGAKKYYCFLCGHAWRVY